jgi:hypothetical protein
VTQWGKPGGAMRAGIGRRARSKRDHGGIRKAQPDTGRATLTLRVMQLASRSALPGSESGDQSPVTISV